MNKLERQLRLLGEVAINEYLEESGKTNDAMSAARDLINLDERVTKYVDGVFMSEEDYFLFPVYTYGFMSVFGESRGVGVREFLIHKLKEEFFHAMLISVDNKNLERFVRVCMNVEETLTEEYLHRVEELNKQKELILSRVKQLNK